MGIEKGITIIIPTYNGGLIFSEGLEMIGRQAYAGPVQLIVVDSGSTDGTIEAAERAGAIIRRIDNGAFHHARTRNMAVSLAAFDRIIFMVQDAVPCSDGWLSGMAHGLEEDGVAAAFAAQIPQMGATPYARFEIESIARARIEAPVLEGVQSLESFQKMPYDRAYRSVGLDNVCAIYRKELLEKTPFPDVDFAEDLAWAVKISLLGHRVLYLPHIQVRHSHNRSPDYAFCRQIVNSYWVARILGRVREDLSHVSLPDLMRITVRVRSFMMQEVQNRRYRLKDGKKEGLFVDRLPGRYPLIHRMRLAGAFSFLSRQWMASSSRAEEMGRKARGDIAYQMAEIEKKYPMRDIDEWFETLEQVTANTLGRIYGEVYASSVLEGRVPRPLEEFVRPLLSGV
ncbi:MAG: hypothetical protein QG552_1597 [Thermodesulfobacteriota bacterium]|nr:hypothetical protein [Thermodesulfobacteriota bacterium]